MKDGYERPEGIGTPPSGVDVNGLIFQLDDLLARAIPCPAVNEARVLVQEVRDYIRLQARIL